MRMPRGDGSDGSNSSDYSDDNNDSTIITVTEVAVIIKPLGTPSPIFVLRNRQTLGSPLILLYSLV